MRVALEVHSKNLKVQKFIYIFLFTDIDECASAPCQNGGTCVNLEDSFKCECPPAWEGNVCQFGK